MLIVDFRPQFNDKLASLFVAARRDGRALTKSQVMVLMLLRRKGGRTATELGEGLDMTKASLTGILDELESRALARRTPDSADRRKAGLSLTDSGRKLADAIAREFDKSLGLRVASLSEAERDELALHLSATTSILARL